MSARPIINVITVVRNAVQALPATLESVLGQDYPELRYIVIDGDSRDGSRELLEGYRARLTHFHSAPDRGIYDAMNQAVTLAEGDLALFINAGDSLCGPTVLREFVEQYYRRDEQAMWLCQLVTDQGQLIEPIRLRLRGRYKLPVHHQAILYPLAALKAVPFDLRFPLAADFHQYYQLAKRLTPHPVPLLLARYDTSGITSTDRRGLNRDFVAAYRDLGIGEHLVWYRKLRILMND